MTKALPREIVEAVASVEDVDPVDLDFVLSEYIDPDALTQLAHHENSTWTLTFELPEHEVTVTIVAIESVRTLDRTPSCDQLCNVFQELL